MKRNVAGFFFLFISFGIIFWALWWRPHHSALATNTTSNANKKLIEIAKESPGRPTVSTIPPEPGCAKFLEDLDSNPFTATMTDLKDHKIVFPGDCENQINKKIWDKIAKDCADINAQSCEVSLFMFRAQRLAEFYKGQPLTGLPIEALVQKIFAILGNSEISPDSILELRQTAQEILSRDPTSKGAAKIEAVTFFMEKLGNLEGGQGVWGDEAEANLQTALERAQNANPQDMQLQEVAALSTYYPLSPPKLEVLARDLQANTENPFLNYLMACGTWRAGNKTQARYYFQKAASLAPDEKRYQVSWMQSQNQSAGQNICSFSVGVGDQDF